MVAIIYQTDKRSGLTYAYESISYWDKEKKQSRAKRRLIGRVNKESGRIVPTDGRGRKRNQAKVDVTKNSLRRFYGVTYLLDEIGKKLGIANDLKPVFQAAINGSSLLPTILFSNPTVLSFDLKSGVFCINIPAIMISPLREAVNSSLA